MVILEATSFLEWYSITNGFGGQDNVLRKD
jgi:hypothetical protein